jgi:outer membrane protein TolC
VAAAGAGQRHLECHVTLGRRLEREPKPRERVGAARAADRDRLVAQLEDGVRTEVERRRLEASTAVERRQASREAVDVAEQSLQRAQRLCDAGQAACIGVLDAEAELTRLRSEWVQSRIDLRLAASQLRRAVGTLSLTSEGTP